MEKKETTRELLIRSGGELFAEHGFEAVSTRMIAERAGVKLSAIHYHFGSKEKLYLQACLEAEGDKLTTCFSVIHNENPALLESPEGQAEIIKSMVFRNFHTYFQTDRPEWKSKILLREITNPTAALQVLVEQSFKPDTDSSIEFYLKIKPDATRAEAAAWSDLFYGTVIFYKTAHNALAQARADIPLDSHFYNMAARKLARAMILEAGLPLTPDLQ